MNEQGDLFGELPAAEPLTRPQRRAHASRGGVPVAVAAVDPDVLALMRRLPSQLRFGTSSWSFPGWRGLVWRDAHAESELARGGLAAYAQSPLLRAVGVDRGFYAPIPRADLERYARAVPDDFRFVVKAHAALTIPDDAPRPAFLGRMRPAFLDVPHALEAVIGPAAEALGAKLGAILFQFSPLGAGPSGSAWLCDPRPLHAALHAFLQALPAGLPYALEWRDAEPLGGEYAALLRDTGAVHGAAAHPRLPPVDAQYERAPGRPGSQRIVRWLLHPGQSYDGARAHYAPFDRLVDPDPVNRARIVAVARDALAQGRNMTVIANNKAEGCAPLSLRAIAAAVP